MSIADTNLKLLKAAKKFRANDELSALKNTTCLAAKTQKKTGSTAIRSTRLLLIFFSVVFYKTACAQTPLTGIVVDAVTKQVLPFATIKFGNTGRGTVSDLYGRFDLKDADKASYIEISYLGYEPKKLQLPLKDTLVILNSGGGSLKEVVIKPPYDKMRRILNAAIANRDKNNPEKYDWYRCRMYYKMTADVLVPDSVLAKDTSKDAREMRDFIDSQHLLMSETYSTRTWRRPQQLQEDVTGSRLSGFKKSMFTNMATDILPFHAYNDYIKLNGKDYHNPVSKGFFTHYDFNLEDEILQGKDTIWILSFRPQKGYDELKGRVYINSDGYAIAYMLAGVYDKQLDRSIKIEQQYKKTEGKWFPNQLNYILNYSLKNDKDKYLVTMKGNTNIDSVSYTEDRKFRFDKVHTIRLDNKADELSDAEWNALRPNALDHKEQRTYVFMDSFANAMHIDKYVQYLSKLAQAKVPIGPVDLDLARLYSYNRYEKTRLGLGLQTNEKLVKWLSVGGWFGYGFGDMDMKYGGFVEAYFDRYKDFTFRFFYNRDLRDPGRASLNRDLDKNYLRMYLLSRVDRIETDGGVATKRFGYWTGEFAAYREKITPMYKYAFNYENTDYTTFTAREASIKLRYAYGERTAPAFGTYYRTGTRYPIWYIKLETGFLEYGADRSKFVQLSSALLYHKHINRLGFEHFLLEGGKSFSDKPLPLSKMFAGNGFRYGDNLSIYAFGGLLTMYPYDYYSDAFVSLIWRHDFDWRLFKANIPGSGFGFAPYISIGHNILYGTMQHPEVHKYVSFAVPNTAYHESGIMLNDILRLKYLNLYYITLNVGYYYHWTPTFDFNKNGRFVWGLGVEL